MITKQKFWYVYILKCSDGMPYTGYTQSLPKRINEHKTGSVISTIERRPLELITYIAFTDQDQAIRYEKYLKSGSGRAILYKRFWR